MTSFIDYEIKREQIHPNPRDPKRVAELAAAVNPKRNRLTLREKQEHCAALGVRPLDDDEIARLYPDVISRNPKVIAHNEEETLMLNPANFGKVKEKADRLATTLKLLEKLRAGEPLELIIGTGGTAQSVILNPTFATHVRERMTLDMEQEAQTIAEEMRELGVLVDLPL